MSNGINKFARNALLYFAGFLMSALLLVGILFGVSQYYAKITVAEIEKTENDLVKLRHINQIIDYAEAHNLYAMGLIVTDEYGSTIGHSFPLLPKQRSNNLNTTSSKPNIVQISNKEQEYILFNTAFSCSINLTNELTIKSLDCYKLSKSNP